MMHRRSVVLAGIGAIGLGRFAAGDDSLAAEIAGAPLAAEIELDGRVYRYHEAAADDLGDYTDPQGHFVQTCRMAVDPDLPMSVMFRRDRGVDRAEIVFELGRTRATEPANLGRYQARLYRGSTRLADIEVPEHYWFSRWRWQSSVRPVRANIATLMRNGSLPPLDMRISGVRTLSEADRTYQPMGLAGICAFMGTTGDRNDIGPLTEVQAEYVCTGRPGALSTLMAQAEAGGTVPWNIRDEDTDAPVDVIAYKTATLYGPNAGTPYIRAAKTPISIDSAHQPPLAYLPFVLTGDPYHLETLQFQATYNVLSLPAAYRTTMVQVRAHAWSLRTLAQAALVTPDRVPRWLLPRAHWGALLGVQHEWLMGSFVDNPQPLADIFHSSHQAFGERAAENIPAQTSIAVWQEDFQAFILAWMVMMGFDAWSPVFRWKLGSTIARTDGRSGWIRAICTPYVMMLRPEAKAPIVGSWRAAWALNEAHQHFAVEDPDRLADRPENYYYFPITRSVLTLARYFDIPEAVACLAWANEQQRAVNAKRVPYFYKWAVAAA